MTACATWQLDGLPDRTFAFIAGTPIRRAIHRSRLGRCTGNVLRNSSPTVYRHPCSLTGGHGATCRLQRDAPVTLSGRIRPFGSAAEPTDRRGWARELAGAESGIGAFRLLDGAVARRCCGLS